MDIRAREYYENVDRAISSDIRTQWEQEITIAESKRMTEPAAMDILGASAKPPVQGHSQELSTDCSAVEEWIQMAIDHEKMQWVPILLCRSGNSRHLYL
jgi:hypothetical protein